MSGPREVWTSAVDTRVHPTPGKAGAGTVSILSLEANLSVFGTAAELLEVAAAFVRAARALDPTNPARAGRCPMCDRTEDPDARDDDEEPSAWFADGYSAAAYGTPDPEYLNDFEPDDRAEYDRGHAAGLAATAACRVGPDEHDPAPDEHDPAPEGTDR